MYFFLHRWIFSISMRANIKNLTDKYRKELLLRNHPPGSRLESIRTLALRLKCSPGTAAKVIKALCDEGLLCSTAGKGTFFMPQKTKNKLKIGYAGPTPSPIMDSIMNDASEGLLNFLDSCKNVEISIVQHRSLKNISETEKLFNDLDGLLLSSNFLDPQTIDVLRTFDIPTVVIGSVKMCSSLLCSQVIPDFSSAMQEFCKVCDLNSYSKIVLLQADHANSAATGEQIRDFLNLSGIKTPVAAEVISPGGNHLSMLHGYDYMGNCSDEKLKTTLFITVSGYIARGMYQYGCKNGFIPDILSVDNLEGHEESVEKNAFFTAIERNTTRCFIEGAKLLMDQLQSGDDCRSILKVPTELIIRRSIKTLIHQNNKKENES